MHQSHRLFTTLFAFVVTTTLAIGEDRLLENEASWELPSSDRVSKLLADGLADPNRSEESIKRAIDKLQSISPQSSDILDAFVSTCEEVLPDFREKLSRIEISPLDIGDSPFLSFPSEIRAQGLLFVGRMLVRQRLFDEALPLLDPLEPSDVVAPDTLLFYRGVCNHSLLNKKDAIEDLTKLLENQDVIPRRYARTAEMMLSDIEPMKEDSLDEIARMMSDVSRRLGLGRSGEPVVEKEQAIIDKLDKIIDKLEQQQKQQQQQQQQQQSGGDGSKSKPMDDSQIAGGNGAGDVDRKHLEERKWGDLPAADRQEALQKISQDLPTHYREAIDAYFRKLATEKR